MIINELMCIGGLNHVNVNFLHVFASIFVIFYECRLCIGMCLMMIVWSVFSVKAFSEIHSPVQLKPI